MDTGLSIVAVRGLAHGATGKELPPAGKLPPTKPSDLAGAYPAVSPEKRPPPVAPAIEAMEKAVKQINELLRDRQRELEFSVDEGSGHTVVKVIHSETGEVIRQLPPEVVLHFANAFTEGSASLMEAFA